MIRVKEKVGGLTISTVADRYEIHPQTLRSYEREGLLTPARSQGNTRLYNEEDLEQLELILTRRRDPQSGYPSTSSTHSESTPMPVSVRPALFSLRSNEGGAAS